MNKTLKITVNIFVFVLIAGFGYYMVRSVMPGGGDMLTGEGDAGNSFVSPYKKINSLKVASEIACFDIYGNRIYVAQSGGKISVFDLDGKRQHDFAINADVRDIVVEEETIYLLYPAGIEVFTVEGKRLAGWPAHRNSADYCSMALSSAYIFVTDAGNKHICRYTREGEFLDIILSPNSFVIPSYAFDIVNILDTLYCCNSGRHRIESYTLEGKYLGSFGTSGAQAGAFAGCCNPAYLAATQYGDILTSEKGNPRISCYGRDGKYRAILLNSKILGGGTDAYKVKTKEDKILVAARKSLSVFVYDPELAAASACAGCPMECPFNN